ncbi:hypothetical protein [Pseudogracilibacillus sp. SO30301A]|uniref:hypothetical protein n=1 Tax=Pseudogracilibacillus sp. SO30301A TaxID=3098291 RepID=UPI00300E64D7
MSRESHVINQFTEEIIEITTRLWARSSISLIDVRNQIYYPDKPLEKCLKYIINECRIRLNKVKCDENGD